MNTSSVSLVSLDAVQETLSAWQVTAHNSGVFALLPEAEKERLPELQAACRERGLALFGGVFPSLVDQQGFVNAGVWLLSLQPTPPTFLISDLDKKDNPANSIAEALEQLLEQSSPAQTPTIFLVFDAMLPNISTILDELYLRLADRVNYVGVNAGSETFKPIPCLFDTNQIVSNGVLGILLPGNVTAALEHGYSAPEQLVMATSTSGNRIRSIDWRPAFSVYKELVQAEYGIDLTPDNFYQYAVHFPFGILRANDEVAVRIPVALTDDGSVFCVGEVPENAMLALLKAPTANAVDCVTGLATKLVANNGSLQERGLLAFYCAGRRLHLGNDASKELTELKKQTSPIQLAGALSLGEIGSTRDGGYPLFHNATLVCLPWPAE